MNSLLPKVQNPESIAIWTKRIADCKSSGLPTQEWCTANGINIKTYYYWQKRVWDKEITDLSPETKTKLLEARSVQFAQVNLGPMDSSSDADIVIRKDPWTVEIRNTASPALLTTVLEAVVRGV